MTTPEEQIRRELEPETGTFPPAMEMRAGQIETATLERYVSAQTKFGRSLGAVLRLSGSGERKTLWFNAVLHREFAQARPKPGTVVGIKYHGQRAGAEYSYHSYSVRFEGEAGSGVELLGAPPEADAPEPAQPAPRDLPEPAGDWRLIPLSNGEQINAKRKFFARAQEVAGLEDPEVLRTEFTKLLGLLGFDRIEEVPRGSAEVLDKAIGEWLPSWAEGGAPRDEDIPF